MRRALLLLLLGTALVSPAALADPIWVGKLSDPNTIIMNSAPAGTGPGISAGGPSSETNVDLNLNAKGGGQVNINNVPNGVSIVTAGASASNADNTNAIQTAINAAVASGGRLVVPAVLNGCYKYTPPLTITGNLTIAGTSLQANWPGTNSINIPAGTPPLTGSVLCPVSNGQHAFASTTPSVNVDISNLGILWQTPFSNTGDCFNFTPTANGQGLTGSIWKNVRCYGHDGNHYAVNLTNFIYDYFEGVQSFGGGVFNLAGNTVATLNYGNTSFVQPFGQVVVGGTANGYTMTSSAAQRLNLLKFYSAQAIVNNINGVSPGGNLPTSAQSMWSQDANTWNVVGIGTDLETNVGSGITTNFAHGNDLGWNNIFTSAGTINAPSWGIQGLLYGPQTRTVNDLTGTGTVAIQGLFAYPGFTQTAAGTVTYTNLATLYIGKPTAGTNVTATRNLSLYTDGAAFFNNSITSTGVFVTGNSQINHNAGTGTTTVCDGTTSGLCTIGGANTLNLAATTLQSGGVAAVTCSGTPTAGFHVTNGIVTAC